MGGRARGWERERESQRRARLRGHYLDHVWGEPLISMVLGPKVKAAAPPATHPSSQLPTFRDPAVSWRTVVSMANHVALRGCELNIGGCCRDMSAVMACGW